MNVTGVIRRPAPWRRWAAPSANELRLASQSAPDARRGFRRYRKSTMQTGRFLQSLALALALAASAMALSAQQPAPAPAATAAAARAFLDEANRELLRLVNAANRAGWVQSTYITSDTEPIAAEANEALIEQPHRATRRRRAGSTRSTLPPVERRQMEVLKNALTMSAPPDPKEAAGADADPGRVDGGRVRTRQVLPARARPATSASTSRRSPRFLAESRDPKRLQEVWEGWHTIARADAKGLRALRRALEQGRDGARLHRHRRDVARQVRHAARGVREGARPAVGSAAAAVSSRCTRTCAARLREKYGAVVPENGSDSRAPPRQHLAAELGEPLPARRAAERRAGVLADRHPEGEEDRAARDGAHRRALLHVARLRAAAEDVLGAVALRQAARSRGRLPRERVGHRQRRRPAHQDVHRRRPRRTSRRSTTSSATTSTSAPTARCRSILRDSANDGFHEAVGDTLALSVTPEYLVKHWPARQSARRLCRHRPPAARRARTPGVPARSGCSSISGAGRCSPDRSTPPNYNRAWWDLKLRYQGVAPPSPRGEQFFDPGRQVPRAGEHAVLALLPRAGPAVPVPPRAREDRRLHGAAAPLLDLREQGGRRAAEGDARDGRVEAVARRARGAHRPARRWTRARWPTTSRRSRRGSTSRTRARRSGGNRGFLQEARRGNRRIRDQEVML